MKRRRFLGSMMSSLFMLLGARALPKPPEQEADPFKVGNINRSVDPADVRPASILNLHSDYRPGIYSTYATEPPPCYGVHLYSATDGKCLRCTRPL